MLVVLWAVSTACTPTLAWGGYDWIEGDFAYADPPAAPTQMEAHLDTQMSEWKRVFPDR